MDANVEKNTTLNHIEGKIVSIPVIDKTLTKSDRSADAKVVGDEIKRLDGRLNEVDPHFAENVQYNNENSGLDATNMQGAIDYFAKETIKPRQNYVGNGDATKREIEVGGTGGWLAICSGSYMIGFISQNGAVIFSTTNSSVRCFPVSQAQYISGKLIISSADILLNGDGNTYHYQVL